MACRNDVFMSKIGFNRLTKEQEVDFDIHNDMPDCKRYRTDKYVSTGDNATYNRYRVPENQFECMRTGCVNSGTLYNEGAETVYFIPYATDFVSGLVTFYVIGGKSATVKISDTADFTNADFYTVTIGEAGADGYSAVVVDLSQTPTETIGDGWTANDSGAYISITVTGDDASAIGISSIAVFDEVADFETSAVVKMACLTGIDGSFDLDAAESTCFSNGGYDTDDLDGFEISITGKALTPNYMRLNPLARKGSTTVGWDITTVEKTVVADGDYGSVTLSDLNQDECGFLTVMLADNCNVTDSQLERLTIPTQIGIDEGHYIAVNNDGETVLYFNKFHVGAPILISYPKTVDIEEWEFTEDAIDGVRTRMSYTKTLTDGTKWRFIYDNVLVTSFPNGVSEDADEDIEITVQIQKDANGRYGRAQRILG